MAKYISSKRVLVRYAEDGGAEKEGIIEIRPGVKDISIGDAKYVMVRLPLGSRWYIEGMAIYSNDIPDGYDVVYYTSKPKGTPLKTAPRNASKAVFKFSDKEVLGGSRIIPTLNVDTLWQSDDKKGFVYNPLEAKARLEKNRKDYIEKLLKFVTANIEREDYEQAVNYIVVAGDNLKALQGVLDYLDAMKDDGYPEFGTIFD